MKYIEIFGASQNNLKNIDVKIPLDSFTVICGLSGSGKSSLAFETLYAEGQKRYLQNTSNYIRQYIDQHRRPDVKQINNLPPALALEQKNNIQSSRSTVATLSGLADHLRLLFEKLGEAFCPKHKVPLKSFSPDSAAKFLLKNHLDERIYILSPVQPSDQTAQLLQELKKKGFSRILVSSSKKKQEIKELSQIKKLPKTEFFVLIDRAVCKKTETSRLQDSLSQAFNFPSIMGWKNDSPLSAVLLLSGKWLWFSAHKKCPFCLFQFPHRFTSALFSFNSPLGACETCEGYGYNLNIDEKKVIPNPELSLKKGAIQPFQMPSGKKSRAKLMNFVKAQKINTETPWCNLSLSQRQKIWKGDKNFKGIDGYFKRLETKKYKMHVRIFLSRYRSPFLCSSCEGTRLKKPVSLIQWKKKNFPEFMEMTLEALETFFNQQTFTRKEQEVGKESLASLKKHLKYLNSVGLSYLRLNRPISTLSGGEFQRLNLSNQLGLTLSQVLYILDEPTVGLHPKDTQRMIALLKDLKDLGNTIVVVEHDQDMIKSSQFIVEMGPASGKHGGEVLWSGLYSDFMKSKKSNTVPYLKKQFIPSRTSRKTNLNSHKFLLKLKGCSGNNLKNVHLDIPLHRFVAVTGVSGSGKSSLIRNTLYPALAQKLNQDYSKVALNHQSLLGAPFLKDVCLMDQLGSGKTKRSFTLSYIKAFDVVRKLFSETSSAKANQFTPSHFSLNVERGRCPSCKGLGYQEIDMVFMDSITITCEECQGKKFKKEVLDVTYQGKNIFEVLNLTVEEALSFFKPQASLLRAFFTLKEVGLSYLTLGQSLPSLSGGEKQRLKLARELINSQQEKTLYIFDEPTKGLHFQEIHLLLKVFHRLVDCGGSVIVIEHNLEVIKEADYIIDMGPLAGEKGGQIVAQGEPLLFINNKKSHTAQYLKKYLEEF